MHDIAIIQQIPLPVVEFSLSERKVPDKPVNRWLILIAGSSDENSKLCETLRARKDVQ